MKKLFYMVALLLVASKLLAQEEHIFFISPFGSDSNTGTYENPFQTIIKARDVVKTLNKKMKGDITVYLRGGVYQIDETIEFDANDSGTGRHSIVYKAYQNEKPVISGGIRIEDWEPYKNGIWQTSVKDIQFRQLYIDGKPCVRARTPNKGAYYQNLMWDVAAREILLDGQHIRRWKNLKKVELIVHMNWGEAIMRLDTFTLSNDEPYTWHTPVHARVRVQQPERDLVFARYFPPKKNEQAWYFENALEFLDAPGEWYHDVAKEVLYYHPKSGEDPNRAEAIIPKVETLVSIKGTLDHPVRNLHFEGITFSHSTWLKPSLEGALNLQGGNYTIAPTERNVQFVERCKAAVYISSAQNCSFKRNQFASLGGSGLDLHYGTKQCIVNANIFRNISANGIQIAKFSDPDFEIHRPYLPDDRREICHQDQITNNFITKIGLNYTGAIGISCGYAREIKITHNEISYTPYSGISVGWGWHMEENAMSRNIIKANHVHHVCQIMCDCGGIYTLSAQPNSEIVKNYIQHVEHAPWAGRTHNTGIYLDEGSAGFLIENNVIRNIDDRIQVVLKGESVFKNNNLYLKEVMDNAGIQPEFKSIIHAYISDNDDRPLKLKHLVMTANLKNEKEAIEKYKYYHSAEGVWPEVVHAAKESGIEQIEIYLQGNRIVMIISVPEDLDMDEMNERYANSSNKIKEWGELMSTFQQGPSGAKEGQIWVPMELIHDYDNGKVK